ncbi:hypothetical protein SASPL_129746 [Salvia splendens]|uniref:F-type H+-transporting ATPase subunit g n=1 Tax=Salvia splendens TaxID=180675 RepID=A0A8X8ZN90_SALSN|nr:hypothetical protein SASPL_129746 [Salvia splendens]
MAARLQQLQSKACQAKQYVTKHGTTYYKQLMEQNKQYVKEPATVETCSELSKQLFYTNLARDTLDSSQATYLLDSSSIPVLNVYLFIIPRRTETFWKEIDHVKNMWRQRQDVKVEDVGIAALFGLECFAWFCAGEIVGRGFTITGYYP